MNNQYKNERLENNNKASLRKSSNISEESIECNLKWPTCIFDNDFKFNIIEYSILSSDSKIFFIDNYFFDRLKMTDIKQRNKSESSECEEWELMVERKIHKCYILKDNIEINFDSIPDLLMNDIFEDQEFEELDDIKESLDKSKLLKRQGMKCNYVKLNQGSKY